MHRSACKSIKDPPDVVSRLILVARCFSLTINGRFSDDAVVCTSLRTYGLRHHQSSNSLLLCALERVPSSLNAGTRRSNSPASSDSGLSLLRPSRPAGAEVTSPQASQSSQAAQPEQLALTLRCTVNHTLELQWVPPKLERLPLMLRASAYEGPEDEPRVLKRLQALQDGTTPELPAPGAGTRLYTMKEVRSVVQASQQELQEGLDRHRIVKLNGECPFAEPAENAR